MLYGFAADLRIAGGVGQGSIQHGLHCELACCVALLLIRTLQGSGAGAVMLGRPLFASHTASLLCLAALHVCLGHDGHAVLQPRDVHT